MPNFSVFKNNWVNPYYGSDEWPACYFDFSIGDIAIVFAVVKST